MRLIVLFLLVACTPKGASEPVAPEGGIPSYVLRSPDAPATRRLDRKLKEHKGAPDPTDDVSAITRHVKKVDTRKADYVDLDGDARADLAFSEGVFFGPSVGFTVFVRRGTRFEQVVNAPGNFSSHAVLDHLVILRFSWDILDPVEPQVTDTLVFDTKTKEWRLWHTYVASSTDVPKAYGTPRPFRFAAEAPLRAQATVDDTVVPEDADYEMQEKYGGMVRGNVVAEYIAGAKGMILAEKPGWLFVAMIDAPASSKLQHGYDQVYDEENETETKWPNGAPIFFGWVASAAAQP
jgi:hypothetical protein